jgi:hypothetical protein
MEQSESSKLWYQNKLKMNPDYNRQRLERFRERHPNYHIKKYLENPDKMNQAVGMQSLLFVTISFLFAGMVRIGGKIQG